jgi:hypothetical protein
MAITIRQGAIGNWNVEFAAIAFSGFLISIGAVLAWEP